MSRLIDADELRKRMYHDAFEVDSDMQRWDGGCWIRYKMFENAIDDAPTVDPVKHAHWEWDDELGANVCSECGRPTYDSHDECVDFMGSKVIALVSPYYCGYCGARMDGGEDG